MTSGDDLLRALILKVHEGPFEAQPWREFLSSLRQAVDARYANILFRRPGPVGKYVKFVDADGDVEAVGQLYAALGERGDPLSYFTMEPGRWYDAPALLDTGEVELHPFYTKFLEPAGMTSIRCLHVTAPGGYQAWVTVTQRTTKGDFTAGHDALFAALSPHIALSLRSFAAIENAQVGDEVAARITAALGFGCVFLDEEARMTSADARARDILAKLGTASVRLGDRVRLPSARLDAALREAIAAIRDGAAPADLVVSRDGPLDMLLMPLHATLVPRSNTPVAALYLAPRVNADVSHQRSAALRTLYGLTRREADLASLLVGGATLAGAAQQMQITEQTARYYSKRIYSKTGTLGQSDLLRTVLTSVAMLI